MLCTSLVRRLACGAAIVCTLAACVGTRPPADTARASDERSGPAVSSVAIRVFQLDAMRAFYTRAFDITFHPVETGSVTSLFGQLGDITIKLVPIRNETDFENFGEVQLGVEVPDVRAVIDLAEEYGGRQEGSISRGGGRVHGAVRDPDGNSIELYAKGR